tara:strand:+ start:709 stop:936 length:228 start_codon:yes stop_codon:yes gene_type:complete
MGIYATYHALCDDCGKEFEDDTGDCESEDVLVEKVKQAGWAVEADDVYCKDCEESDIRPDPEGYEREWMARAGTL